MHCWVIQPDGHGCDCAHAISFRHTMCTIHVFYLMALYIAFRNPRRAKANRGRGGADRGGGQGGSGDGSGSADDGEAQSTPLVTYCL